MKETREGGAEREKSEGCIGDLHSGPRTMSPTAVGVRELWSACSQHRIFSLQKCLLELVIEVASRRWQWDWTAEVKCWRNVLAMRRSQKTAC